jgi:hypothetical protein
MSIKGYAFNIQAYNSDKDGTIVDIFYINMSEDNIEKLENYKFDKVNNTISVLRLYNFDMEFMLHKLPGQESHVFKSFVKNVVDKFEHVKVEFTEDFVAEKEFTRRLTTTKPKNS